MAKNGGKRILAIVVALSGLTGALIAGGSAFRWAGATDVRQDALELRLVEAIIVERTDAAAHKTDARQIEERQHKINEINDARVRVMQTNAATTRVHLENMVKSLESINKKLDR